MRNYIYGQLTFFLLLCSGFLSAQTCTTQDELTTLFNQNNSFAGNMFDITVNADKPVLIEKFDVNLDNPGANSTISVYYRPGTYVGFQNDPSGWTLMGTDIVTSNGTNNPTEANIGGLEIPAGETYGIYVTVDYPSSSMLYTNGNNVFSDGNITLELGIGKGNPDFTGETFTPRTFNGTVYYCLLEPIPTLGQWGLLSMGSLLMLLVTVFVKRVKLSYSMLRNNFATISKIFAVVAMIYLAIILPIFIYSGIATFWDFPAGLSVAVIVSLWYFVAVHADSKESEIQFT